MFPRAWHLLSHQLLTVRTGEMLVRLVSIGAKVTLGTLLLTCPREPVDLESASSSQRNSSWVILQQQLLHLILTKEDP